MMIYAPVLITTLNRYECLKKCIESLQDNTDINKTELFISVDFPPNDKYISGYSKIKKYLENGISGFKKVNIYFQSVNLGSIKNNEWLKDLVSSRYDRFIFLEDDNEVAPSFIQYCNKCLEFFEDDDDIVAINGSDYVWCGNGYTPPIRRPKINQNNIEKRQLTFHSVAYWTKKNKEVIDFCLEIEQNNGFLNIKQFFKLKKISNCFFYNYLSSVVLQRSQLPWYDSHIKPIDFMRDIYMMLNDKYVISPIEPMQRDNGVRGNGVNYIEPFSNARELYNRELRSEATFNIVLNDNLVENKNELYLHDKYFDLSLLSKSKIILKYILFLLTKGK